jgi:hypothetical protein
MLAPIYIVEATPRPKTSVKLPELKPKKDPRGGLKVGFNDNLTLVRGCARR